MQNSKWKLSQWTTRRRGRAGQRRRVVREEHRALRPRRGLGERGHPGGAGTVRVAGDGVAARRAWPQEPRRRQSHHRHPGQCAFGVLPAVERPVLRRGRQGFDRCSWVCMYIYMSLIYIYIYTHTHTKCIVIFVSLFSFPFFVLFIRGKWCPRLYVTWQKSAFHYCSNRTQILYPVGFFFFFSFVDFGEIGVKLEFSKHSLIQFPIINEWRK